MTKRRRIFNYITDLLKVILSTSFFILMWCADIAWFRMGDERQALWFLVIGFISSTLMVSLCWFTDKLK